MTKNEVLKLTKDFTHRSPGMPGDKWIEISFNEEDNTSKEPENIEEYFKKLLGPKAKFEVYEMLDDTIVVVNYR